MQHLAYQPLFPTGNKYLQQKWDKASYDMHRRKVKSAKTTISTAPPMTYDHLALNLKKQKLEEERVMKIQRENNMLLEKISYIMRTAGQTDNRNYYERKSIGRERRQLELLQIAKENQVILFRLSRSQSHYNVRSWHEDWLKTLKVMDSIARYPRGRANEQKRQEISSKRSSERDSEEKTSSESNTTNGKAESEDKDEEKETNKKEEAGARIHGDTGTHTKQGHLGSPPTPSPPERSSSTDTPETPSAPDPITNTHPHTAERSPLSDRSATNSPHTPHTSRLSTPGTPDTHEQETAASGYKDATEEEGDALFF